MSRGNSWKIRVQGPHRKHPNDFTMVIWDGRSLNCRSLGLAGNEIQPELVFSLLRFKMNATWGSYLRSNVSIFLSRVLIRLASNYDVIHLVASWTVIYNENTNLFRNTKTTGQVWNSRNHRDHGMKANHWFLLFISLRQKILYSFCSPHDTREAVLQQEVTKQSISFLCFRIFKFQVIPVVNTGAKALRL